MNSLFTVLIVVLAVMRLGTTGLGGQLVFDALLAAGIFLLPVFWRRRGQGAEFLTQSRESQGGESGQDFLGVAVRSQRIRLWLMGWCGVLLLVYGASMLTSLHSGYTFHAFRQVISGVLLLGLLISIRWDAASPLDVLLGVVWSFWLLVFLMPLWGEFLPAVEKILENPFPQLAALDGEGDRFGVAYGVVALEVWLCCAVLLFQGRSRKGLALIGHTLLWGVWGGIGSEWLVVYAAVAAVLAGAVCWFRQRFYWGWAGSLVALGGLAWWAAGHWLTMQQWLSPQRGGFGSFGEFSRLADLKAALFRFPWGVGAQGHEWVEPVFEAPFLQQQIPGGQQILWLADLGLAGPLLGLILAVLLVYSVRYVGVAYQQRLEASRDPQALQAVKESEYPLSPALLPATLLAWLALTLLLRNFDLYRTPVFWIYLGLWIAWLSGRPVQKQRGWGRWLMPLRICLVGVAVLFLLVVVSRETGRVYYRRALAADDPAQWKVALDSAQYWDRWNPQYSFMLAEQALVQGERTPAAILTGLRWSERGLNMAPAHAEGHILRSRFLRADGQIFSALEEAEKAVFFAPSRVDFRWELGGLYESVGRTEAARSEFSSVLNLEPHNIEAMIALGRLAEKESRYADAAETYRQVLLLDRRRESVLRRYENLKNRLKQEPI